MQRIQTTLFTLTTLILIAGCNYEGPKKNQLNKQPLKTVAGAELEHQLKTGIKQLLKGDAITSSQLGVAPPYRPLTTASANSDEGESRKASQTLFNGQNWFAATHHQDRFYEDNPSNGFLIASNDQPVTIEGRYRDTTTPEDFVFVAKMERYSPEHNKTYSPQAGSQALAGQPIISDAKFPSILEQPSIFTILNGYSPNEINPPTIVPSPQVSLDGLFLLPSDHVATISTVSGSDTMLQFVDTTNINEPELAWEVTIEGHAADALQVNDSIILVSERTLEEDGLLHLSGIASSNAKAETDSHNSAILEQLDGQDLITQYSVEGVTAPLTTNCMTQEPTDSKFGMQRLINITAISPTEKSVKSLCISGDYKVVGLTENTVFLLGSTDDDSGGNTIIHAFDISSGTPVYSATESVPGKLYSVSQTLTASDILEARIITRDQNDVISVHRIPYKDREFQVSLSLEITSPGEKLLSHFYSSDNAYFFIDPPLAGTRRILRSVDLTTNQIDDGKSFPAAYISGRGHLVGERFLLSIRGSSEAYYAELYDLLGERFYPFQRERINYQTGSQNSNFILTTSSKESARFAFSTSAYQSHSRLDSGIPSQGVQMLEIKDLETSIPSITDAGFISMDGLSGGRYTPPLQIGLSMDTLLAHKESALWRAEWGDNTIRRAPVIPVPCERTPINGVRVTLERVLDFGPNHLCESEVVLLDRATDQREVLQSIETESNADQCVFEGAYDRYDSFEYEVTVPEIDGTFSASINPGGSYCSPEQAEVKLEIAPKSYCDQLTAPSFVMGIRTNNDDHTAACSATLVATYIDREYNFQTSAIPIEELPDRYKNMLSDDIKCALLGPDVTPPYYRGTDIDLAVTIEGYDSIFASSRTTQNGQCLPRVVAFEAIASPL